MVTGLFGQKHALLCAHRGWLIFAYFCCGVSQYVAALCVKAQLYLQAMTIL